MKRYDALGDAWRLRGRSNRERVGAAFNLPSAPRDINLDLRHSFAGGGGELGERLARLLHRFGIELERVFVL